MSGATKISGELQAGTSGTTDSSAMETEEYYNPEGGEWSQKVDTGQLCRVCANPNEYLIPIFDGEGLEHELSVKIEKHLPIKVTETDALPQQMCYQCASTLIAWHDLVLNCVEADKKLRELQADEDDDDDDKGAEMFESHSMDSDPADEVDQPSTSESQITAKLQVPKKTVLSKDKKPKLKMVLVKGSLAGTSGQKTVAKTQVAKALELAKSKEGGNEDSASERSQTSFKVYQQLQRDATTKLYNKSVSQNKDTHLNVTENIDPEPGNSKQVNNFPLAKSTETKSSSVKKKESRDSFFSSSDSDDNGRDSNLSPMKNSSKQGNQQRTDSEDNNLSTSETEDEDYFLPVFQDMKDKLLVTRGEKKQAYTCEHCGKMYDRKDYYNDHLNIHLGLLPYVCQVCGKQFRTSRSVTVHIERVHEKKRDHACDICGMRYPLKSLRDDHRRKHTGERPMMCDVCGKRFRSYILLYDHKKSHKNIFPYSCTYCEKKFKKYGHLKEHIVSHTEEKPYPCEICGKGFGTKNRLRHHSHIHSNIKPHVCELCGRGFKRREHLKAHGKTHKGYHQM